VGHRSHTVVKNSSLQAEVCWQKIHGVLFNSVSPPKQRAMLERFVGECELLGGLHHLYCTVPRCVLEQGSPLSVLMMEYPVCLSGEVRCPTQGDLLWYTA